LKKDINGKKVSFPSDVLRETENEAIRQTVKKVESIGMKSITDGEFRRDYFHLDFLQQLEGVTVTGGNWCKPACQSSGGWLSRRLSLALQEN
jgi:5-methyltetrahydropteroyltriglutamate--homocysteine methyltransferase